jgi:two-component system response regulator RegA
VETVVDALRLGAQDYLLKPLLLDDVLYKEALQAYEKSHIEHVLKRLDGDKKSAAEALGMSLSSLYCKIEELDLHPE